VDDRIVGLESTVEQLRTAVQAVQRRLDALEAGRAAETTASIGLPADVAATADVSAAQHVATTRGWRDPIVVLSLLGRLLIVLGGGFFLRAMTDTGALAPTIGVALGFAYGLVWLALADRAGQRQHAPSAVFHALAAAMVAFPLLVEATSRFKVLSGTAGALVIAVLTAGLLLVAWRRRLHAVAWLTAIVALPTSVVMLGQTGVVVPFAFYLIAFGIATLWMGYALDWMALRWPVALVADMVVLGVTMRALAPEHQDAPNIAMLVQLSLLGAYVISIAIRTLVRGRNVIPFEVVQTTAALVIGFGGAVSVTRATGELPTMLGVASLGFAVASYGLAFAFIDRREDRARNVYFYTSLALVLAIVGLSLVLDGRSLGLACAALAVVAAGLWSRVGRLFMLLHGAAYLVTAGIVTDTLSYGTWALIAGSVGPWAPPGVMMPVVLVAGALSAALAATEPAADDSALASGPRFVIILVLVWTAGGFVIGYLAPAFGGMADRAVDIGVLATVRTGVLAISTLLVAWIGRHLRFREWGWLVYPLLIGIGLKMVAHDFMQSRPVTLFIALALYGAALIVAPRLRRPSQSA